MDGYFDAANALKVTATSFGKLSRRMIASSCGVARQAIEIVCFDCSSLRGMLALCSDVGWGLVLTWRAC